LQLDRHYSPEELRRAAVLLNEQFRGRTLDQVRQEMLNDLAATRERLNQGMLDSVTMAQQLFPTPTAVQGMEYVIAGQTNLMGFSELSSVDKLRRLFESFNEKRDLLNLLDLSIRGQGVQIFIGQESGHEILGDCSIITAPYSTDSGAVGVLGVIGPTRMAYDRVVPIVDLTESVPDAEVLRLLPPRVIFKLRCAPVARNGRTLRIATSDPTDLASFDELRIVTGHAIELVLALGCGCERGSSIAARSWQRESLHLWNGPRTGWARRRRRRDPPPARGAALPDRPR
jgi:hypothetical protein